MRKRRVSEQTKQLLKTGRFVVNFSALSVLTIVCVGLMAETLKLVIEILRG